MYNHEALYFTSTIILVDDDPSFLKVLSGRLSEKFIVKAFSHPHEAIAYLKGIQKLVDTISPSAVVDEELEYGERYLSITKMNVLAENKTKQEMPTVVISDYTMPEMNGIEFFEKISEMPVMKILLTGNADLDLALYAFNRNIVNKFLVKNSPKILSDVEESIIACQHDFFRKCSYPILNNLNIPDDSLLRQRNRGAELEKMMKDHHVVEYYLIDNIGSYLLITQTGERIYFICMVDRQFSEYAEVAVTSRAPVEIINGLNERTHAPVFLSEDDYKLSTKDWASIVRPFERKNGYYFCVIK